MRLDFLCDLDLRFVGEVVSVRPHGGHEGAIYGVGEGSLRGERLNGRLRWTNHPRIRGDNVTLPDLHGVVETDDGASLLLSLRGYSVLLGEGPQRDSIYAITFQAEDERYRWLNTAFCIAEGAFNVEAHTAEARVYVCINELVAELGLS